MKMNKNPNKQKTNCRDSHSAFVSCNPPHIPHFSSSFFEKLRCDTYDVSTRLHLLYIASICSSSSTESGCLKIGYQWLQHRTCQGVVFKLFTLNIKNGHYANTIRSNLTLGPSISVQFGLRLINQGDLKAEIIASTCPNIHPSSIAYQGLNCRVSSSSRST